MTTFNSANYQEPAAAEPPTPNESITDPVNQTNATAQIDPVQTAEIMVQGSVAEIVAKSLYSVFPQVQTLSSEGKADEIRLTVPAKASAQIQITAISREDIINEPVKTLRSVNRAGALVYIDMQGKPVTTKQEDWFYTNVTSECYHLLSTLTQRVKNLCLV